MRHLMKSAATETLTAATLTVLRPRPSENLLQCLGLGCIDGPLFRIQSCRPTLYGADTTLQCFNLDYRDATFNVICKFVISDTKRFYQTGTNAGNNFNLVLSYDHCVIL